MTSFGTEHFLTLSHLPSLPSLVSAARERLMFAWWDREVAYGRLRGELLKELSRNRSLGVPEERDPTQRILIQVCQTANIQSPMLNLRREKRILRQSLSLMMGDCWPLLLTVVVDFLPWESGLRVTSLRYAKWKHHPCLP